MPPRWRQPGGGDRMGPTGVLKWPLMIAVWVMVVIMMGLAAGAASPVRKPLSAKAKFPLYLPWKHDGHQLNPLLEQIECQHPEWCRDLYDPVETVQVMNWIDAQQRPLNCSQEEQKYLVLTGIHLFGVGSLLHIRAYALGLALSDGRMLVEDSDMAALHWIGKICPRADILSCWLQPFQHCPLPVDWQKTAEPHRPGSTARITWIKYTGNQVPLIDRAPWQAKPPSWHIAILTAYLLHPSPQFLQLKLRPAFQRTFGNHTLHQGQPPFPLASIFVRSGDKSTEAELYPVEAYFEKAAPLLDQYGIQHVFLASDSAAEIERGIGLFGRRYQIYTLDIDRRLPTGYFHNQAESHSFSVIDLTFADIFISSYAQLFVGDLRSNQCRLIDELRRVNLQANAPLLTPGPVNFITQYDPRPARRLRRQRRPSLVNRIAAYFGFSAAPPEPSSDRSAGSTE